AYWTYLGLCPVRRECVPGVATPRRSIRRALVVPGDGRGDGQHYGTGVLPEHRGHGLGLWMKAESVRRARERHPELGGLLTDTADSNTHMRGINDVLGYLPTHAAVEYQLDL
ncbi:hypothetical protein AB0G99_02300, partial [Streptomyces aurantiacus]